MEISTQNYLYDVSLNWDQEMKNGIIRSGSRMPVLFSPPPEFNGTENVWSPEHLLVASLSSCYVTTFFHFVKIMKVSVSKFRLSATVEFEKGDKSFEATRFILRPTVEMQSNPGHLVLAGLFDKAKKYCFISNSIKGNVVIEPIVEYV